MRIVKALCFFCVVGFLSAAAYSQSPPERTRLYTVPDPGNPGGLKGHITKPSMALEQILAIPASSPESVYQGEISGPKRDSFQFKGLPAGKCDLIAIYDNAF